MKHSQSKWCISGSAIEKSVELRWGTATEVNNYGYNVLRTDTSNNWLVIDFVQGYGNSYSPKDYVYYDTTITENGEYFYRLKQIDFDGNFELTHDTVKVMVDYITSIEDGINSTFELQPETITLHQNYPDPSNPSTTISFTVNENSHVLLKIFNINGEEIKTLWDKYTNFGTYYVKFNATGLSSGIYFYRLSANDIVLNKKFK